MVEMWLRYRWFCYNDQPKTENQFFNIKINHLSTIFQLWHFTFRLGWFLVKFLLRSWFLVYHDNKIINPKQISMSRMAEKSWGSTLKRLINVESLIGWSVSHWWGHSTLEMLKQQLQKEWSFSEITRGGGLKGDKKNVGQCFRQVKFEYIFYKDFF